MSLEGPRSPELTPEVKHQLTTKLGSLLHDEWRASRKISIEEVKSQLQQAGEENREACEAPWGTQDAKDSSRAAANQLQAKKDYLVGLGNKEVFEPRVKVLMQHSDGKQKWYNEGDDKIPKDAREIRRQDIANTNFKDLDAHWQADNGAAAEVAMSEVFEAFESGTSLTDPSFLEEASAVVHAKWLERNGWQATDIQKQPYGQLPEEEKEKDRAQVRKAIIILEGSKQIAKK